MNNKKRSNIRLETIIIFLIAICMIFLIDFTHDKLNDFAKVEQEALLINHDPSNPVHNQLAQEIIKYRPGVYKMIEIYKPNMEIMMTLQFENNAKYHTNLNEYPELTELFLKNKEGHTQLTIDNELEDIYFKWIDDASMDKYLILIYTSRHQVQDLYIFDFVCYMVLLLIFFLLIRIHISGYGDKIKQYKDKSDDIRNRLMR